MNGRGNTSSTELLIEQIYASAIRPSLWPQTLRAMAAYTGSADCLYQSFTMDGVRAISALTISGSLDDSAFEKHAQIMSEFGDVRGEFAVRMPTGNIYQDCHFIDEAQARHHPYYQELLMPLGLRYVAMVAALVEQDGIRRTGLGFGLQRTPRQGPLDGPALRRFEALVPHLARASRIARRFGVESPVPQVDSAERVPEACFRLDARGRVMEMNAPAERCLRVGMVAITADGELRFVNSDVQQRVLRAMRGTIERDTRIPTTGWFTHGRRYWNFEFAPTPDAADFDQVAAMQLSIYPTPRPAGAYRNALLSPAEERLGTALAAGRSLRQTADSLGISYQTARTQLKSAMRKLGLHSQAALVAHILLTRLPDLR